MDRSRIEREYIEPMIPFKLQAPLSADREINKGSEVTGQWTE